MNLSLTPLTPQLPSASVGWWELAGLLLVARSLLAGVFLVAGVTKLADRDGFRAAVVGFGLPQAAAGALAVLIPFAEVAVGVALIPSSSARWGALGALVLLVCFAVGIAVNLSKGREPDCHCFGRLHSAPAGRSTLIRNAALAAVAAFVAIAGWRDPGPSLVGSFNGLRAAQGVALIVGATATLVVFQAWLILHLLRQNGRLLLRVDATDAAMREDAAPSPGNVRTPGYGLAPGSPAPTFALPATSGDMVSLDDLLVDEKPVLLVFTAPGCGACSDLMPDVATWQRAHASTFTVAVLSSGVSGADVVRYGFETVLLQHRHEVGEAYGSPGTPSAVIVGPDGTVLSPLAAGAHDIRSLVARTVQPQGRSVPIGPAENGHQRATPVLRVGEAAPAVRLPDLHGRTVDVTEFRPAPVLLLFWDPSCGFCQRLLPDLLAWESEPRPEAPRLVVVSTGSVQDNLTTGLRSTVLLDPASTMRSSFGVTGTPIGVLLDEHGRVASELGVGAQGVLRLAGGTGGIDATEQARKELANG